MLFHDMSVALYLHIIISSCHVTFHKTAAAMSNHHRAEQSSRFSLSLRAAATLYKLKHQYAAEGFEATENSCS